MYNLKSVSVLLAAALSYVGAASIADMTAAIDNGTILGILEIDYPRANESFAVNDTVEMSFSWDKPGDWTFALIAGKHNSDLDSKNITFNSTVTSAKYNYTFIGPREDLDPQNRSTAFYLGIKPLYKDKFWDNEATNLTQPLKLYNGNRTCWHDYRLDGDDKVVESDKGNCPKKAESAAEKLVGGNWLYMVVAAIAFPLIWARESRYRFYLL